MWNPPSLKRKATMLKKRESIILEAKPSIKPRQIVGKYFKIIYHWPLNCMNKSIYISICLSIYIFIYFPFILISLNFNFKPIWNFQSTNDIPSYHPHFNIDHKLHDSTYALPEKTKRGPPTNKNISVRNIMAQISNMSANENAGFKSEYHVRLSFSDL